ncbi:MAG: hypothetical protein WCR20_15385 [Verrucomicrobiota bacterium]|nr:hypothetical protein [Verrucomicrobiota bacterium]
MTLNARSALLLTGSGIVAIGGFFPFALVVREHVFLYQSQQQSELEYFAADLLRATLLGLSGLAVASVLLWLSQKPSKGSTASKP